MESQKGKDTNLINKFPFEMIPSIEGMPRIVYRRRRLMWGQDAFTWDARLFQRSLRGVCDPLFQFSSVVYVRGGRGRGIQTIIVESTPSEGLNWSLKLLEASPNSDLFVQLPSVSTDAACPAAQRDLMGRQTLFRGIAQALVAKLAVKTISCLLLVSVLEGLASTLYLSTEIP
jgi:hypothetical protein